MTTSSLPPRYHDIATTHLDDAELVAVRARLLPVTLGHGAGVALFLAAGYPRERVFAYAFFGALAVVVQLSRSRGSRFGERLWSNAFHGAMVVATGGLASPVVALLLPVVVSSMIELPNARAMRWLFLQTAALILAAAVTTLLWPLPPAPAWCLAWGSALCFGLVLALIAHRAARIVRAFTRAGTELERNRHELLTAWQERTRDAQAVSATIAHELKNPLASIKGLVELVAPRAEDERARKRYGVILHEIARMQTTIDEYLDYARPIHVLDVAETRLERVAVEVVALLEARARSHDVRLEVVGRATIVGDARRLREALLNLIANALQACGADDRVRVEIQETTLGARLVIADSGRGMNAEELAQVGTAYYTTRAGGTGLGVVLSRAVIEQHGGSLDYASAKGQGTRVTVELPSIPVVTQPVSVRSADRARRLVS